MPKARKNFNINNFISAISSNWQGDGTTGGFQVSVDGFSASNSSFGTSFVTVTSEPFTGSSTLV